jgi:hypothetical protein
MNKYKKTKLENRGHKVTSVNLEVYQSETLKKENINLSLLVRDLLEDFLSKNFGKEYLRQKKLFRETHD